MKKATYVISSSFLILSMVFTSCGPGKKLVASRVHVNNLQMDSTSTHGQLNDCNVQVNSLMDERSALQKEKASYKMINLHCKMRTQQLKMILKIFIHHPK